MHEEKMRPEGASQLTYCPIIEYWSYSREQHVALMLHCHGPLDFSHRRQSAQQAVTSRRSPIRANGAYYTKNPATRAGSKFGITDSSTLLPIGVPLANECNCHLGNMVAKRQYKPSEPDSATADPKPLQSMLFCLIGFLNFSPSTIRCFGHCNIHSNMGSMRLGQERRADKEQPIKHYADQDGAHFISPTRILVVPVHIASLHMTLSSPHVPRHQLQ